MEIFDNLGNTSKNFMKGRTFKYEKKKYQKKP